MNKDDIKLPPLHYDELPESDDLIPAMHNYARKAVKADRQRRGEPMVWRPIDTAPKDNKRCLYLARLDECGRLVELDFDGTWEYWEESWEMSHINGWCWMSANGIEEPTHWAYQDEELPMIAQPEGFQSAPKGLVKLMPEELASLKSSGEDVSVGYPAAQYANARLIAAAPELLDALEGIMRVEARDRVMPVGAEWDAARAAIDAAMEKKSD